MGEELKKPMKVVNYIVVNIYDDNWAKKVGPIQKWQPYGYPFSHEGGIWQAFVIYEEDMESEKNKKRPYIRCEGLNEAHEDKVERILSYDLDTVPIDVLPLLVRTYNCLKAEGITTVGQLINKKEKEFYNVINFGTKSLNDVKGALAEFGLKLKD